MSLSGGRKFVRTVKRKTFSLLPNAVRHEAIRGRISVPLRRKTEMVFKLAESELELMKAFQLLHDCYVDQEFIKPQKSKMRILPHFVLPTTATLVAKYQGEVVGTLSIIKKSRLPLPMEKEFSLEHIRNLGDRYAEISALAVKKEFRRHQGGSVFFLMLKFMYHYCVEELGIRYICIVIHPKDEDFYAAIMFFRRLPSQPIVNYMNAPALAMFLDLDEALVEFKRVYFGRSPARDLYTFFLGEAPELQFIERPYHLRSFSIVTPEIFSSLFLERGNLFQNILYSEFLCLKAALKKSQLERFFKFDESRGGDSRSHLRFDVFMSGTVIIKGKKIPVSIYEASLLGLGVESAKDWNVKVGEKVHIQVNLGRKSNSKLVGKVVWIQQGKYGLRILVGDKSWENFCVYISHSRAKNYLLK